MKLRKINQITQNRPSCLNCNLSLDYQKPFDYFLNTDIGSKSLSELNQYYVSDDKTEFSLKELLVENVDSITALIGYGGIGKSSDIRHSYQIMNNSIKLDRKNKTIIFPSFFKGNVPGEMSVNTTEIYNDIRLEVSKRIESVCQAIEEDLPDLADEFETDKGKDLFYKYIKYTNPKALADINTLGRKDRDEKIENAFKNDYFIYTVTKLKYYLSSPLCNYNRILIILDDIESFSDQYQEMLILQYLRFCTCLRNFPDIKINKKVYIKMLISLRPTTYKRLNKAKQALGYLNIKEIYKTQSISLSKYFTKKYANIPNDIKNNNEDKYKEAYNILINLSEKFEDKYSNMIKRLTFMSLVDTLEVYRHILSNSTWIIKQISSSDDAKSKIVYEYVFNNITVIRALACGSNTVYLNNIDNLIPNILYDTMDKRNSLYSLYIISYFIHQQAGFWEYGEVTVKKTMLIQDFCDVFGESHDLINNLSDVLTYLYQRGILSIGISDLKPERSILLDSSLLYLSSKGLEIWSMLSSDSVLMELYREDFYQEWDESKPFRFSSSRELMNKNLQSIIFKEVYNILLDLVDIEKKKVEQAIKNKSYNKYLCIFGDESMIEHLMIGVDKSIEYSGNKMNEDIDEKSVELKEKINNIKNLYTY